MKGQASRLAFFVRSLIKHLCFVTLLFRGRVRLSDRFLDFAVTLINDLIVVVLIALLIVVIIVVTETLRCAI